MVRFQKLVSMALILCLCATLFPTIARAAGSVIPEEATEYGELRDFLHDFHFGWGDRTFDFRNINTSVSTSLDELNILQAVIGHGSCYVGFVSDASPYRETIWGGRDPLGRSSSNYWEGYTKSDGSQTEWVLANVFNCSQTDISSLRSSLNSSERHYYLDGYYYSMAGGIGDDMQEAIIKDITPYEDYYLVSYELRTIEKYYGSDKLVGRFFAALQRKTNETTGAGYWSLYYNKLLKDGETLNLPTSSTNTTPASIDNFTDVKKSDYFYNAARWGVEQGIINGTSTGVTSTFSPNQDCTKAQILTFLWRANGSPEPTRSNPFYDISQNDYFYKAAIWANEKRLVYSSAFNPNEPCTRAMAVDYLWKLSGSPVVEGNTFSDVPYTSEYVRAVLWAVSAGVTGGTGGTYFSPDMVCTRAQIITFIYRAAGYETVTPPNLASSIADSYSDWNQAYQDFVMNGKYLTAAYDYSDVSNPSEPWSDMFEKGATLYDMDKDGVPELFIFNGDGSRLGAGYYTYTFTNGQIVYIGRVSWPSYKPGSKFTGIWSYWTASGTDPDLFYYYWKDGTQLHYDLVYSQETENAPKKQETNNKALYDEFVSVEYFSLPGLSVKTMQDIRSMGWNAFVSSMPN